MQRILVVERDQMIQHLLTHALRRLDYEALVLSDGRLAPAALAEDRQIALAILNHIQPHPPEMELLQHVRSHHPHLPILVMSAHHDFCRQALANGATQCMLKPFQIHEFSRVIRSLIQ